MEEFITLIGLAAGFLTTAAFLPQVLKSYKTRHTKDLALGWVVMIAVGIFLWLIYGILSGDLPVIAANIVSLALALALLGLKIKYG